MVALCLFRLIILILLTFCLVLFFSGLGSTALSIFTCICFQLDLDALFIRSTNKLQMLQPSSCCGRKLNIWKYVFPLCLLLFANTSHWPWVSTNFHEWKQKHFQTKWVKQYYITECSMKYKNLCVSRNVGRDYWPAQAGVIPLMRWSTTNANTGLPSTLFGTPICLPTKVQYLIHNLANRLVKSLSVREIIIKFIKY